MGSKDSPVVLKDLRYINGAQKKTNENNKNEISDKNDMDSTENKPGRNQLLNQLKGTKPLVHLFVIVFAISSWVDVNGLWVALPLLVLSAPEGWKLPSYMSIVIQIANIGPLIFIMVSIFAPRTKPKLEKVTSFLIVAVGFVALILLAFFWDKTTYVAGAERSTAFLILTFFLSLVDTTSSVCYYAFMAHMKLAYIPSLTFGEGLSGFIPAMVALGQGAGHINCVNLTYDNLSDPEIIPKYNIEPRYTEPRFSVQTFIFIIAAFMFLSGLAFLLLNFLPYCKSEFVNEKTSSGEEYEYTNYGSVDEETEQTSADKHENGNTTPDIYHISNGDNFYPVVASTDPSSGQNGALHTDIGNSKTSLTKSCGDRSDENSETKGKLLKNISMGAFVLFQICLVVINMTLTTFLPTIQVYSSLPYNLEIYHLTATLVQITNPVACLFAIFFTVRSLAAILIITAAGQVGVAYIIYVAVMSPDPPMAGDVTGGAVIVTVWILTTLLLIYSKVCIASVMREQGRTALICLGAFTQVGTLIGAVVGFLLVNHYNLFVSADYC